MKKYIKYLVVLLFLIIALFYSSGNKKISVFNKKYNRVSGTTEYHDFSDTNAIDKEYSYSNIFFTKDTTFEVLKAPGTIEYEIVGNYRIFKKLTMTKENEEIKVLIKNCGYDKNNKPIDVVITLKNLDTWSSDSKAMLEIIPMAVFNNQMNPGNSYYDKQFSKAEIGMPISFATYADDAEVDVSINYYYSNTYNKDNDKGIPLNITKVNGLYYDIDGTASNMGHIADGREGFKPTTGVSNIYYNKNKKPTVDGRLATLQERDNGVYIDRNPFNLRVEAVFYQTAAYVTTDDIKDSTYTFKYSGAGAGIIYTFASPYKYDSKNPVKKSDTNNIYGASGSSITYNIDFVVPNNYMTSQFNFSEVHSNIVSGKITAFEFSDTVTGSLTVDEVEVFDAEGTNVSSKFQITKENIGGNTKVIAKVVDTALFNDPKFYNGKYELRIKTRLMPNVSFPELANTADVKICDSTGCVVKTSNTEKTPIYYIATKKFINVDTNQEIILSRTQPLNSGTVINDDWYKEFVKTDPIPQEYKFVRYESDFTGEILNSNINVVYYYRLKKYTVTVKYYLENTTDSVMDDKVITKSHGEAYTTDTNGLPSKYEVKNNPANKSGTLVKNEEVIYYVGLKKAKLTVKYLKEDNTPLYPQEEKEVEYDSIYSTTPKNDEHYKVVEIIGKERDTVDKDNIEVIYKYKLKDSEIDTSITMSGDKDISDLSKLINYDINYRAAIKHYNGNVVIKIVDTIPYKIDTDKSILNGGVYDSDNLTITWTYNWNNITFTDNTKDITINAKLKYIDVPNTTKLITNKVEGYLEKDGKTNKVITTISSKVGIPSKVVVKHLIKGTNDKLGEDVIITDKVIGDSVSIKEIEKEGYRVVEKPVEVFTIEDKVVEKIYYYEKIKVKVTTKSNNPGGEIVGDEEIEYGKDSTPNKIKIRTKRGFLIDRVLINGKEVNIPKDKDYLEIDNFDNLKEDKLIEVFYKEGEVNPETSNNINSIVLLVSIIIISTISVFMYRKVKKS